MSDDATAYVYQNIGVDSEQVSDDATAYVYQNIGLQAESRLGAVYGLASPQLTPIAYVYQNVTA